MGPRRSRGVGRLMPTIKSFSELARARSAGMLVSVRTERDPADGVSFHRVEVNRLGATWLSQRMPLREQADLAAACIADYIGAELRI